MKIQSIFDPAFAAYGKVIPGYDVKELMAEVEKLPCPEDGTVYMASVPELEALPIYKEFSEQVFGGMPIEIGYCGGTKNILDCLEYHRDSEVNLACRDAVIVIGKESDIDFEKFEYDTSKVEAFKVPKGTLYELYSTTLHYAPCNLEDKFITAVVLPKGTNTPLTFKPNCEGESKMLGATNKWLMAHPDSPEAKNGSYVGLKGVNPKFD